MKKNKKHGSAVKFAVIDIDETTSEPKLVELSQEEYEARVGDTGEVHPDSITVSDENVKSAGKQIVMNKVFGFDDKETVGKRQKFFKRLTTCLFILLVGGVLFYTAYNDFFSEKKTLPPQEYWANLFATRWYYILLAALSLFLCYALKAFKHSLLSYKLKGKWNVRACFSTAVLGLYYNYVTPLAVGGQPFEIYNLTKNGFSGGEASSMTLSSFILHQIAFVLLGVVSLILYAGNVLKIPQNMISAIPNVISVIAGIGLALAFSVPLFVVLFSFNSRLGEKIVSFVFFLGRKLRLVKNPKETKKKTLQSLSVNANCLKKLAAQPVLFISEFLLSLAEQFALCSIAYFTLKFFGFRWHSDNEILEWLQVVQLCFILYAAISFIPTPGNSGAADLSFYLLFDTGLGLSGTDTVYGGLAFPAMVVWRLLSFYGFIIIGFIYTTAKRNRRKKSPTNETPV